MRITEFLEDEQYYSSVIPVVQHITYWIIVIIIGKNVL